MKRIVALILAFTLLATCALAESAVGKLFDAAVDLAYDTHNVTLTAKADFTWDGESFKTMRASYKQDDFNSLLDYMLDTPKPDGTVYTGGYTVLGLGRNVYANETYWGNYYYDSAQVESDTVLTSNAKVRYMLGLARTLAVTAEGLGVSVMDVNDAGTEYHFEVGDLPAYIDDAVFYLVSDYTYDHYYRSFFNEKYEYSGVQAYYEDWTGFIGELYKKLYNEEMTDEADDMRLGVVYTWANQLEQEMLADYETGYVFIKKDGTCVLFDNEADCMRAAGVINITYNDYSAAFRAFMLTKGEELTDDIINILMYSPNPVLWEAYYGAQLECEKYYAAAAREINPDAVTATVLADGSIKVSDSLASTRYISLTQQIMSEMKSAGLKSMSADIALDSEGRLTGFKGSAQVEIIDVDNVSHILGIVFETEALDYGTTYVNSVFNPADYGWVTYDEYTEAGTGSDEDDTEFDWEEFLNNAPDTITFMGETYDTMMYEYR